MPRFTPSRAVLSVAVTVPALLGAGGLAACAQPAAAGTTPVSTGLPASRAAAATPAQQALAVLRRMTTTQQVGQLIMAGVPATAPGQADTLVTRWHVGQVFLAGRSYAGVAATAAATSALRRLATATTAPTQGVGLWIATDQEGGLVQVLNGPGFSRIPSAVDQGALPTATLRADSALWAGQLARAGIDVDLAPVTDVVPGNPQDNPPIGYFHREYGRSPAAVERAVTAVVAGYSASGVAATLKHFPGLGKVTQNTDTTAGVTDHLTTRSAVTEVPWKAGITAGAGLVMVSSAIYSKIDPRHVAAFSSPIITGMLRGDLHYNGVVISDDLGNAIAVASVEPGLRAVNFIASGGDVVLTVNAALVPRMIQAITHHAATSPAFRAKVRAAVLRVLTRKAQMGLLPPH